MIMLLAPDLQLLLTLFLGAVLPLIVGLVTKLSTNPGVRAVILLGLSALAGLGTEMLNALDNDTVYHLESGIVNWVITFALAVLTHFGLWKPTGAATAVQAIGDGGAKHRVSQP